MYLPNHVHKHVAYLFIVRNGTTERLNLTQEHVGSLRASILVGRSSVELSFAIQEVQIELKWLRYAVVVNIYCGTSVITL